LLSFAFHVPAVIEMKSSLDVGRLCLTSQKKKKKKKNKERKKEKRQRDIEPFLFQINLSTGIAHYFSWRSRSYATLIKRE
jgi:hypothetical protein